MHEFTVMVCVLRCKQQMISVFNMADKHHVIFVFFVKKECLGPFKMLCFSNFASNEGIKALFDLGWFSFAFFLAQARPCAPCCAETWRHNVLLLQVLYVNSDMRQTFYHLLLTYICVKINAVKLFIIISAKNIKIGRLWWMMKAW